MTEDQNDEIVDPPDEEDAPPMPKNDPVPVPEIILQDVPDEG